MVPAPMVLAAADQDTRDMRTNLMRKTIPWGLVAVISLVAVACGDDSGGSAEAAAPAAAPAEDPAESTYCDLARAWSIRALDPVDDTDPMAFRAYWEDFMAAEQEALAAAPDELQDEWTLRIDTENATVNPVFEAYDYDIEAIVTTGTPEEQATLDSPPEVDAAIDTIHAYEVDVCAALQPPPADVSFEGEEPGPYCDLVAAENEQIASVLYGDADPAALEEVATALIESSAEIEAAAPEVIADEVVALRAWQAGPQRDVLERHDWDLAAALVDGPQEDREDLQYTAPEIREEYAVTLAYEEQVCGLG